MSSLRGSIQPELSRKLYKLIKTTNNLITAHETAGRERATIASQLSEWGEQTEDEAISDVSDKVGVIMSEMGEQEDIYAHAVDDSRGVLKQIRDTEKSVQPSRDGKRKIADEIAKLKSKEPESTRLVTLEQELVRAEAENLVAEAQLTNIVSDQIPSRPLDMLLLVHVTLTLNDRLVKSSRKLTTPNFSPPSSEPKSKSFLPDTVAVSYSFWTTVLSFRVRGNILTNMALRLDRS